MSLLLDLRVGLATAEKPNLVIWGGTLGNASVNLKTEFIRGNQ